MKLPFSILRCHPPKKARHKIKNVISNNSTNTSQTRFPNKIQGADNFNQDLNISDGHLPEN